MIRAIRPSAMAHDDASLVAGWNVAPNLAYTVVLLPSPASCGVLLYDEAGSVLIATGAALVGTAQPCVLIPQTGQTVGMVDADLGWHLLVTTAGTESQRTIRLGPAVDLPDEIHPVYGDDDIALARATAAINEAAHYVDDITVTCPLGLGAGLGDVVSVPVDGVAVIGQVESITWTATPDGATETAVIRRHVAIAPEAVIEPTPPTVADDTGAATHLTGTSGNVLANDEAGLTVVAVNGLAANVGQAVDGDNGGSFTLAADGSWTFSPVGDFALLEGSETADTSITYHASDGTAEAMATLTVTVSHANAAPVAANDTGTTDAATTTSGNVLTNDTDADGDTLTVSKVGGSAGNVGQAVAGSNGGLFTIASTGAWTFDPDGDFSALTGGQTATTSVTYHVSDGVDEDEGTLAVTVSAASAALWTPAEITTAQWIDFDDGTKRTVDSGVFTQAADKSGNSRNATASGSARPSLFTDGNGRDWAVFDGIDDFMSISVPMVNGSSILMVVDTADLQTGDRAIFDRSVVGAPYPPAPYLGRSPGYDYKPSIFWGSAWAGSMASTFRAIGILQYRFGAGSVGMRLNGGAEASAATTQTVVSTWTTLNSNSTQRSKCKVGEYVIINSAVDASTREKIEGYLAHKWGLTASLPSDHPYKSAPPTI